ncbi:MAG: hypothetical protein Q9157_000269 [Trypethelium eluteriae]
METHSTTGLDLNAVDDDEEFFDGIKEEPLSPPPSRPQSSPLPPDESTTPTPTEYEPETKPEPTIHKKPKTESFPIPRVLLNMFDAPPGCSNDDYMARLQKVRKARNNRMNIFYKRMKEMRGQSEYENAPKQELKALQDRVRAEVQEQDMRDGRHFTLVAKRLGLVLKKVEGNQRTPTLASADDDEEFLMHSSASYDSNRVAGGRLRQKPAAANSWPEKDRSGVPIQSAGASDSIKLFVGPARKTQTDVVRSKVEPETMDERPKKIVKSAWPGEWESLEFSFDVLYREAHERYQGIAEDEENHREGPMTDALVKSEAVLNSLLMEQETKAEESEEKGRHEDGLQGGEAEKREIMKEESETGIRGEIKRESAEKELRKREAKVKMESDLEN